MTVWSTVQPCPECRNGKHANCDGRTWSDHADQHVSCPCDERGHK